MKDLLRGLGSAGLGALAGAGLAATSLVAVEALMPQRGAANTNVRDMLNNAEMAWGMGDNQTACLSISVAIQSTGPMMDSQFGATTSAQKADLTRYARRCNLRY